jgi:hypothetical protein
MTDNRDHLSPTGPPWAVLPEWRQLFRNNCAELLQLFGAASPGLF